MSEKYINKFIYKAKMKYLKTYEAIKNQPLVGDYVICSENIINPNKEMRELIRFESENIGQLVEIYAGEHDYKIKYENIPKFIGRNFDKNIRIFARSEIKYWAKTKEKLELKLQMDKYNL